MAAPDLENGNLRSSHREMSAVKLKFANSYLHELATQFVETRIKDHCIRQRLQPDKESIIKRGTFFVMENESRSDPGFLLLLPKQPAVFMMTRPSGQNKKIPAWTLRMRTDVTLGDGGGTLLIATLDKIQHTLRLEDVWVWKGEDMYTTKPFSQRRVYMKKFVEDCWTPDARLMGGIQTTLANPKPLSSLATIDRCFSVDLIPEAAGKRRFWFQLEQAAAGPAQPAARTYQEAAPMFRTNAPALHDTSTAATAGRVKAFAVPLDSLPDVYDLFLENGTPLSRAAVQQLALSQRLRASKEKRIPVVAQWQTEFGRYEIVDIE
jgi:hypothetical protein